MRNKRIRDSLIRAVGRFQLHVTDRADPQRVGALIASLRPVDLGYDLVRVGPNGDGGYLVPDDLAGIRFAFSPGVANESGFEAALAERGLTVFLADHSVDGPAQRNPSFHFKKKYLGSLSNETYMTLAEWKAAELADTADDLLLQMDIEGGEYDTLLDAPAELLRQFRIMVIEFHWLHELFNRPFFEVASRVFAKLLQTHSVVHIHPNNCCGSVRADGLEIPRIAEFTFQRNDRARATSACTVFPHPLDRDNTRKRTLVLPACWYRA